MMDDDFDDAGDRAPRPRRVKRGALSSSSSEEDDINDEDLEATSTPRRVKRASVDLEDDEDGVEDDDDLDEDDDDDGDEDGARENVASGMEDEEDEMAHGREVGRRRSTSAGTGDDTDGGDDDISDLGRGLDAAAASTATASLSGSGIRPARYHVDQRVFAFDKGDIYEAVVIKTRLRAARSGPGASAPDDDEGQGAQHNWSYFVHYQGWSKKWDKWLDESDLRDDTAEVRAMAEKVREKTAEAERTRKQRAKERKERKQRAKEARREARKEAKRRKKMGPDLGECCELPFTLRTVAVDDRERIVRLGRHVASGYDDVERFPDWKPARLVHVLPASPTISLVLGHYAKWKRRELLKRAEEDETNDGREEGSDEDRTKATREERILAAKGEAEEKAEMCQSFVDDLLRLFDKALPLTLLYKQERTQYLSISRDPDLQEKRMSELYGCEHLLRLFVRLPVLMRSATVAQLTPDPQSVANFGANVSDLIIFLQKNRNSCFKAKYREPREGEWTEAERAVVQMCATKTTSDDD